MVSPMFVSRQLLEKLIGPLDSAVLSCTMKLTAILDSTRWVPSHTAVAFSCRFELCNATVPSKTVSSRTTVVTTSVYDSIALVPTL